MDPDHGVPAVGAVVENLGPLDPKSPDRDVAEVELFEELQDVHLDDERQKLLVPLRARLGAAVQGHRVGEDSPVVPVCVDVIRAGHDEGSLVVHEEEVPLLPEGLGAEHPEVGALDPGGPGKPGDRAPLHEQGAALGILHLTSRVAFRRMAPEACGQPEAGEKDRDQSYWDSRHPLPPRWQLSTRGLSVRE